MLVRRSVHVPVVLDCGCTVTPMDDDHPLESGGRLVHCPGHGIRHSVDVAEEVRTFTYTARRVDPPDPEPEESIDPAHVPHVYTVAAVLHGIATAPCTVCGAGRNGSLHVLAATS